MVRAYPDLAMETVYDRELVITVDRERARFSSWYEMFPRSQAADGRCAWHLCRLRGAVALCERDGI